MANKQNSTIPDAEIPHLKLRTFCNAKRVPMVLQSRIAPDPNDLWHTHTDFCELVIVVNGNSSNEFSENRILKMQPGDVVLMMPGSLHRYTKIKQFKYYNILFAPELLDIIPGFLSQMPNYEHFRKTPENMPHILHLGERDFSKAATLLEEMMQEQLNNSVGHEEALFADFYRLLVYILRYGKTSGNATRSSTIAFQLGQIIFYMEAHSNQDLSVGSLSRQARMSESSFRHRFKELTGLSPLDYLIRLRLQKAVLMLLHSDYQITQIALESGFSDSNYFARKFRDIFKRSPRDFRIKALQGKLNVNDELKKLNLPQT